jgi:hypothetical protein
MGLQSWGKRKLRQTGSKCSYGRRFVFACLPTGRFPGKSDLVRVDDVKVAGCNGASKPTYTGYQHRQRLRKDPKPLKTRPFVSRMRPISKN